MPHQPHAKGHCLQVEPSQPLASVAVVSEASGARGPQYGGHSRRAASLRGQQPRRQLTADGPPRTAMLSCLAPSLTCTQVRTNTHCQTAMWQAAGRDL